MLHSPAQRWIRVAIVVGLALALVVAAVVVAVQRPAPGPAAAPPPHTTVPTHGSPAPTREADPGESLPLAASPDPVGFARAVATAIFDWDTTAPVALAELKGRLLVVADPTGQESPGLVDDLAAYLPSAAAWEHLRAYETRQWLTVTQAAVPAAWTAVIGADPDAVAPGTYGVTITGTRHRAGIWEGQAVTSTDDVAFTVFVVCAPTYPDCHLLRLTQLGSPLR